MNTRTLRQELLAVLVPMILLGLGLLAGRLSMTCLSIEGELVLVTVLLMPMFGYALFSGRLHELRGPGGIMAKFTRVAEQSVGIASETLESVGGNLTAIELENWADAVRLRGSIHHIDESEPVILTVTMGTERPNVQVHADLHDYVKALREHPSFKGAVLLDQNNRFIGYIPDWAVLPILVEEMEDSQELEFVSKLNKGDREQLRRHPGVTTETIRDDYTNMEALQELVARNLKTLIVVDGDGKFKGVIERDRLVGKLLLGLAS